MFMYDTIFEYTKSRYVQLKGQASYDKLYDKINRSDALTQLCGLSIRQGVSPTPKDFIYKATMIPSIYLTYCCWMCVVTLDKTIMGFFSRFSDFGDREQIRTIAMRIGIGLQQIEQEDEPHSLKGLCSVVARDVEYMRTLASKLSQNSLASLTVQFKGQKIPYTSFLRKIDEISASAVRRGGDYLL